MSKLTIWKHSAKSETLQAARTSTPTANACSWGFHQEELSESKVNLEEVQESKPKHDIINELIQENKFLKKMWGFREKMELKDKALNDEKYNHYVTNENLISKLLEVESLEKILTLVCYTILLKSTQN